MLLQSGLASIVIPASNTPVILASESIISVVFPHHNVRMSKILLLRKFGVAITNAYMQPTGNFRRVLGATFDQPTQLRAILRDSLFPPKPATTFYGRANSTW
ncbi:uncharacterized protein EV154DRAFT_608400 [Mucor mucedo]|uniref:uncharacterized protein n=1 Tax=Mucor mucedo TaxID=29922 RepID=UPI002220C76B|nr:uncharacterized protein EV154DRAFT_608400 [Mucor mucedo]KAI7863393.1 hypothetical protein EV154DRAFT_608400 [Mucor mucedo]